MATKRIVSGMRPTGRMHLGHVHGALLNWKKLQENYRVFLLHRGLARPDQ